MVTKRVPRDERLHLRYLNQLTYPPTNKKVISTVSLWILFVQLQSCAYSIKTKSYVVENVVEMSLSPVGPKYNLITEPSH